MIIPMFCIIGSSMLDILLVISGHLSLHYSTLGEAATDVLFSAAGPPMLLLVGSLWLVSEAWPGLSSIKGDSVSHSSFLSFFPLGHNDQVPRLL